MPAFLYAGRGLFGLLARVVFSFWTKEEIMASSVRFPNESPEYRSSRDQLLLEPASRPATDKPFKRRRILPAYQELLDARALEGGTDSTKIIQEDRDNR
jgi:hypothetical protein